MNNTTIKGVVRKIYSINYDNINLENNTELIISKNTNDFHQLLFMNDEVTNTYLIPYFENENKSAQTGLFYKDNSFYNHPVYGEKLISFRLSLSGIKNNSSYRIRFVVSPIEYLVDAPSKLYTVLNGKDVMYNQNISSDNTTIDYIFTSEESIMNIAVTIGKIYIKDIIIEEIELKAQPLKEIEKVVIPNLMNLKAYAVFKPTMLKNVDKDITKFPILRGIGLNILFDRTKDLLLIERNKENDVINNNIAIAKYLTDIKTFNGGEVSDININNEISKLSNTRGYISFKLDDFTEDTIIYVLIYELL